MEDQCRVRVIRDLPNLRTWVELVDLEFRHHMRARWAVPNTCMAGHTSAFRRVAGRLILRRQGSSSGHPWVEMGYGSVAGRWGNFGFRFLAHTRLGFSGGVSGC